MVNWNDPTILHLHIVHMFLECCSFTLKLSPFAIWTHFYSFYFDILCKQTAETAWDLQSWKWMQTGWMMRTRAVPQVTEYLIHAEHTLHCLVLSAWLPPCVNRLRSLASQLSPFQPAGCWNVTMTQRAIVASFLVVLPYLCPRHHLVTRGRSLALLCVDWAPV